MIPRDTYDGAFYRAVLALHMDQYQLAQQVSGSSSGQSPNTSCECIFFLLSVH